MKSCAKPISINFNNVWCIWIIYLTKWIIRLVHSDHYHSLVNNSVFTLLIRIFDLKKKDNKTIFLRYWYMKMHQCFHEKVKESNRGNNCSQEPQTEEETRSRDSSNTDNNYKVNRTTFFLQVHGYQLQLCLHFKLTG